MKSELKQCKHCKKIPESVTRIFSRNSCIPNRYKVFCCENTTATYETEKGAIAAWNKRMEEKT